MKRLFLLLLFISCSLFGGTHIRVIIDAYDDADLSPYIASSELPYTVLDFNNISGSEDVIFGDGNFKIRCGYSSGGYAYVNIYGKFTSNSDYQQLVSGRRYSSEGSGLWNITWHSSSYLDFSPSVNFEIRHDSNGEDAFDETDRILRPIQFIDFNGDRIVDHNELYTAGVNASPFASTPIWLWDRDEDSMGDSGELFLDSAGHNGKDCGDNTPILSGLDLDGDGTPDNGDDEEEDEEDEDEEDEDEEELAEFLDRMPALQELMDKFDISSISIPSGKDPTKIDFDLAGRSYSFQGLMSNTYTASAIDGFKIILQLYFTYLFISAMLKNLVRS